MDTCHVIHRGSGSLDADSARNRMTSGKVETAKAFTSMNRLLSIKILLPGERSEKREAATVFRSR